jgi:L-threonylcarbamoyladenylate synthase
MKSDFEQALFLLRSSNVVAIPTETVYGLAGDISKPDAIDKIFKIKMRPFFDPLIVHLADRAQADQVVEVFPPLAEKLAAAFWPGPLTIVLPKKSHLNPKITSGLETVGIRVPKHELTRRLLKELGSPLAAPSANKFGQTSPTTASHVRDEFASCADEVFVLDGGPCEVGVESTVIGFNDSFSEIHIYRPGMITDTDLQKYAHVRIKNSPAAPGQLEHHYMPKIPLIILSSMGLTIDNYESICQKLGLQYLHPSWMSLPSEASLAARTLYQNLREAAAKAHSNCILLKHNISAQKSSSSWDAIDDRLKKAAKLIL